MLIVQKYGGTSVGSVDKIKAVARRALATQRQGHRVIVISSAMSGETNRLTALADAIDASANNRERDVLLATGEQAAVALVAMAIGEAGGKARSFLAHQVRIETSSDFSKARIKQIDASALDSALDHDIIPVITGFQGVDAEGNVTTLGRGGGDTSAVAVAASINADLCEIYTDVKGVYTTDPNVCSDARLIRRISYNEMMELASLGAKVLQIRAVELAGKYSVPVHVRSSFSQDEGTLMVSEEKALEHIVVTGVSLDRNQARITVRHAPLHAQLQSTLFRPLADAGVVVDMIVQNPPEDGRTNLSFTVPRVELKQALGLVGELKQKIGFDELQSDEAIAKVSIVGLGMRSHAGVAQRMFDILAEHDISVWMISTSEIKVSCVIPDDKGKDAVRALHAGFGLDKEPAAEG